MKIYFDLHKFFNQSHSLRINWWGGGDFGCWVLGTVKFYW